MLPALLSACSLRALPSPVPQLEPLARAAIMERLMEDLSFTATERAGEQVVLGTDDVQKAVGALLGKSDLKRFLL